MNNELEEMILTKESKMNLIPPDDKLIVHIETLEETSASGLVVATAQAVQEHPHQTMRAEVLYAGHGIPYIVTKQHIKAIKAVKAGDFILFEQRHSAPCDVDGKTCKVISYKNILGVIHE